MAGLFCISDYNLTAWITDCMEETAGNYYTQRCYIAGATMVRRRCVTTAVAAEVR